MWFSWAGPFYEHCLISVFFTSFGRRDGLGHGFYHGYGHGLIFGHRDGRGHGHRETVRTTSQRGRDSEG
jgi:hypothetical protein